MIKLKKTEHKTTRYISSMINIESIYNIKKTDNIFDNLGKSVVEITKK